MQYTIAEAKLDFFYSKVNAHPYRFKTQPKLSKHTWSLPLTLVLQ